MGQAAAAAALGGDQGCVRSARDRFETRRDRMLERLRAIPGIACLAPAGAFYVFAAVQGLLGRRRQVTHAVLASDVGVAAYLLEQASVAVIDGQSCGPSPCLRLSFATSTAQIERGCQAIALAVAQLQ